MPIAITEEQRALQAAVRDWAKSMDPITMVRQLEPGSQPGSASGGSPAGAPSAGSTAGAPSAGPNPTYVGDAARCWSGLVELGIFSIALPGEVGGADGTVADLAAALEQVTAALIPGPAMPTLLAALLLAGAPAGPVRPESTSHPAGLALLTELAAGRASAAVAFSAGTLRGAGQADGTLRVTGDTGLVLGAGSTTHLLLAAAVPAADGPAAEGAAVEGPAAPAGQDGAVWFLVPASQPGLTLRPRPPVDFSRTLADVRLDEAVIGPEQIIAGLGTSRVRDLAATLAAVEAATVASWCCDTAAQYARTRHQFGRAIGSFQAVKHLCAGMLCRADRATALAWDAARAADEAPDEHPLAAAAAAALALDAAVDNAKDCIQVLGGIGFTWEHDAHLYLRRALAVRQLLGGSAAWQRRVAELALAGARRRLGVSLASQETLRGSATVREVAAAVAALPEKQRRAALADAGYVAPQWPPPYGQSASLATQLVIDEELNRAGLARPDLVIGGWAGHAILQHGTPAQRDRFIWPTLRGEITWCQLFSEPEAGSDLAGVRTRAEPVTGGGEGEAGGAWRLTGQKVWTSLAHQADWAICLARTDPTVAKHRGLSYFLVDMTSPGIDIRPLREITGRAMFNEVFLDGVVVPGDCLLGQPGEGWRIARSTLAAERTAMGRGSAFGEDVEGLIGVVRAAGLDQDPAVAGQLGGLVADGLAGSLLDLRATLAELGGAEPGQQAAVRKLIGVAHRQAVAEAALTLSGPDGAAADGAAADAVHQFLLTRCLSIAGGTSQILLSLVGERVLGLPREEVR
ncbi:MAG TPA: acyl-CoA dehydrogenase family protein [Streptosporangiaceae bacterium]